MPNRSTSTARRRRSGSSPGWSTPSTGWTPSLKSIAAASPTRRPGWPAIEPRLGETFPLQGELDDKLAQLAEIEADLAGTEGVGQREPSGTAKGHRRLNGISLRVAPCPATPLILIATVGKQAAKSENSNRRGNGEESGEQEMAAASPSAAARVRRAVRSRAAHALAPSGRDAPRGRGLPEQQGG